LPHDHLILRLSLIFAAVGAALVPLPASWVEALYSQRAYLALQRVVTAASNRAPFALFDVLIGAALAWLIFTVLRLPRRWRKTGAARALGALVLGWAAAAAVVYLAFLAAWGLNYRRPPLASRLSFSRERVTESAAKTLAARIVPRANQLHTAGGGGVDWAGVMPLLAPSFDRVQQQLAQVTPATPGRPKRTLLTLWFERAGVDGMTDPFLLETLVNSSILPFERPSVAAHEWAHLAGYADESEANFVGWLVCLQGPPAAEYSGHLALLWQVLPALSREDRAALPPLSAGVRSDLKAIAERVAKATPVFREASWRVYDKYLKANRVEKGIRSYDAALELVLGTRFDDGWVPQRAR
jgi:hypothetical protein